MFKLNSFWLKCYQKIDTLTDSEVVGKEDFWKDHNYKQLFNRIFLSEL